MDNKRKALGRGLEQLFSNETIDIDAFEKKIVEDSRKDITEVNLNELRSNPYQPRQYFKEDKLQELAESIKEYGVIEPIIIKKSIKGYEIVAGERRAKASKIAGLSTIPAIIKDFSDEEMMQIALLENIQREDLSVIEEASAYKKILQSSNITQEELSKKIGKSRSYITNIIGVLRLPVDIQDKVLKGELSAAHAKLLSKLSNVNQIKELTEKIIKEKINVRELEDIIGNVQYEKSSPIKTSKKVDNSQYLYVQTIMREKIGTMVKINNKKITIPYDSDKDLERILNILNIKINEE